MFLLVYLKINRISAIKFGKKIGHCKWTVHNWLNGRTLPSISIQDQIVKATNGLVTPHDHTDYYRLANGNRLGKQLKGALGCKSKKSKKPKNAIPNDAENTTKATRCPPHNNHEVESAKAG